jgi:hypothetical protein
VQPTGSANDCRLLHEETENTEEITVKISPVKPRAKAAATALKGNYFILLRSFINPSFS